MKKLTILLVLLLICSVHLKSQWISNYFNNNQGDNPIMNSKGLAVTVDENNYCYVAGYTYNETTGYDIILIKYTPSGDTIYSKVYSGNGTEEDKAFGIIVDQAGYIYITGQVSMIGRSTELVLLKYSSDGSLVWARTYGATASAKEDKGQAIAADQEGNIYVTGFSTGEDGYKDILIQKYNGDGVLLWTKTEDGDGNMNSEGSGIAIDFDNFVYVTGYTTAAGSGKIDAITLKYSLDGASKWVRIFNGSGNNDDRAYAIALDGGERDIYVTGYTTEGSDTSNTSTLLIKYGSNGSLKWIKTFDSGNPGSSDKAWGIIVDSDNRVYITGQTESGSGGLNYLTIKYGPGGNQQWVSAYNGTGNEDDIANSIGKLTNGKIVVTGASTGTNEDFDYATITLNRNSGSVQQVSRYSMAGNTNDIAMDVACSDNNQIYVTGFSELVIDNQGPETSVISTLSINGGENENNINTNIPEKFNLYQNYPNPFNPATTIKFDISANTNVSLVVYDILGNVIDILVNQNMDAGSYSISYKNTNLASGIYFYQLTAGNYKDVKKMTLVK